MWIALFTVATLGLQEPQQRPESLLTAPLYLEERPPECRSLRLIRLGYDPGKREQAEVTVRNLQELLQAGADFGELARLHSRAPSARNGGVLGTHPPGVLVPAFDHFLFNAELGDVSEPIDLDGALHLLQRIERWAACRQIYLKGRGDDVGASAELLFEQLQAGADFEERARELSDDPVSAARGGAWRIFERGAKDSLLKGAVFKAEVGELIGPLRSPLGFHIARRDALEGFDPSLREENWVRARAILIAHQHSASVKADRSPESASILAREIHALMEHRPTDMAELARRHTDEPGGRKRGGDLGWIYRGNSNRLGPLGKLFLIPPGTLLEPKKTEEGWIVLQRTR